MYIVGENTKMHRCLTFIVLKELHEGVVGGNFAIDIIKNNNLDAGYWWPILFKDIHDFCKKCDNC